MHAITSPAEEHKHLKLDYASTHQDIVEKCKRGNRRAQFELYKLYSNAMYNVCLRMLRHEQDAEDLLQNSFVDVFTKLHTFRYQASIGAWIKRIVVNNCINHLKRNRLRLEELEEEHAKETAPEPEGGNHQGVATKAEIERIRKAVLQLPDGYRVVFTLYAFEGYDHKEIADILGVSEATSKSQYSRARQKLRKLL
ncbi:RNA polymerase sigma factor [Phaeodactylibacter luteus]|uniref:RNA polymerase sigma factor n=1 Tax=Phaeodactylibacter luteus TaxID=1564516 RepID=A0A5C6RM01_9BACT|nr:RNA polymerase sigma factor [Phaeodactylibacter luteus]TXB63283.1 RNA polymerase sigma factor [Phaeodactylibacter luteus]